MVQIVSLYISWMGILLSYSVKGQHALRPDMGRYRASRTKTLSGRFLP